MQAEVRASTSALKAAEAKAANYAKQVAAMDPPTAQEAAALQRGLSPLARGNQAAAGGELQCEGPIPAGAGEPNW